MADKLKIQYRNINELLKYEKNSRTHSDGQVKQIANSIKEFGFTNPLLIRNDQIIAGHGRLDAAKSLDMKDVPTINLENLSDSQAKALVIADNQLALNAGWDLDLLKLEIEELAVDEFDIDVLGFDDSELNNVLKDLDFRPSSESEQGDLGEIEPKYINCPNCGKEFDTRDSL